MPNPLPHEFQPATPARLLPVALDAGALDRLRALDPTGNAGVVRRVFQAYASSLSRLMGQLVTARAAGDLAAVRHVTHTLKSSSASIGALTFSSRCAEIETMVRQNQCEGLEACLDGLASEAAQVSEAVQAMLVN